MFFTKVCVLLSIFVITNSFVLDSFFGPKTQCKADTDCTNGCCHTYVSQFGDKYNKCSNYILPAGACEVALKYSCGCMPGYECASPGTDGLALEPNTQVKGFCKPVNGTGPQIAVEGGR